MSGERPCLTTRRRYMVAGAILLALLLASAVASQVHLGSANLVISLVIAACKAAVVGWVFMGLDEAPTMQRLVAGAGIAALVVLAGLSSVDLSVRRDEPTAWQQPQRVPPLLRQVHEPLK